MQGCCIYIIYSKTQLKKVRAFSIVATVRRDDPLQHVSWVKYLRLEQWQRPREAHVPPFASALPEHFFLEPGARGASGGSDDCSAFSF
jgi:hypothetical protein